LSTAGTIRSYLVCTTPRSGSGYLCDTLWRTGYFGQPDEYFCDGGFHPDYPVPGGGRDGQQYADMVRRLATGRNGVMGVKIMWEHFRALLDSRAARKSGPQDDLAVAEVLFPNLRFVWLSRQNKLHQATSLYRRLKTGVIFHREGKPRAIECPAPIPEELDELISRLEEIDECWRKFFEVNGIAPCVIHYEAMLKDIDPVINRLADYLDIDLPPDFSAPVSNYQRLFDDATVDWIREYEEVRGPYVCGS